MEYIPINGQKEYCDKIRELSGAMDKDKPVNEVSLNRLTILRKNFKSMYLQTPDFVEATIFSKHEAVLMVGHFANVKNAEEEAHINHVARWYKPWFYKHVEGFLNKPPSQEFIPLREYLLRHNRAIFWVVESMIPFGNNPLFR